MRNRKKGKVHRRQLVSRFSGITRSTLHGQLLSRFSSEIARFADLNFKTILLKSTSSANVGEVVTPPEEEEEEEDTSCLGTKSLDVMNMPPTTPPQRG